MITTPSGKVIIDKKIPVFCFNHLVQLFLRNIFLPKKRIGKDRECKHRSMSSLTYNFHKYFLNIDKIFNVINSKCSVWEDDTSKQILQVWTVKYRNICKCTLIDSKEGLVQSINKLLKILT